MHDDCFNNIYIWNNHYYDYNENDIDGNKTTA